MQRRLATAALVMSSIVVPAWFSGCGGHGAGHGEQHATIVKYVEPTAQEVTDYFFVTGRMDATQSVDVRSRVTGYLVEINFKPGEEITSDSPLFPPKGSEFRDPNNKDPDADNPESKNPDTKQVPLFKIDPRPYQAVFDQANSQVQLAQARLELAKADLARAKKIAETPGAISQQEIDTYSATQAEAAASLSAAEAARESAQLNLEFTDVVAPIGGIVGRNLITVGNLVTQDSTLLTTIVSQDPIYAYFDVDERTLLNIQQLIREGKIESQRAGAEVPVQLGLSNEGSEYPHSGFIDFVNNAIDSSTGTIQVRGEFRNPLPKNGTTRLFTPGLFVRVRVPIGKPHEAIVVPQAAIVSDQGQKFLYIVNKDNVVEYRPIQVGPIQADGLQVAIPMPIVRTKEGVRVASSTEKGEPSIALGEKIVLAGLQRIRPGMTVDPQPANKAAE